MPQFHQVDIPESDTEIVEELITERRTKRGVSMKKTRTPMTQSLPTKADKPSGSRAKPKKKPQAPQAEKATRAVEDDDIIQTYEVGNEFEYQPDDFAEEVQLQGNVCQLWIEMDLLHIFDICQTPMDQWLQHRSTYLNVILEMEGRSTSHNCSRCSQGPAYIKCSDCFRGNTFCKPCCLQYHRRSPFHHLLQWNGKHYSPISLYSLGFILFLGHNGTPCPKTMEVFTL